MFTVTNLESSDTGGASEQLKIRTVSLALLAPGLAAFADPSEGFAAMSEVAQRKRARLGTSPPREGLQLLPESAEEAGKSPDTSKLLLCEVAQQALQKYSLGVMRIPLNFDALSGVHGFRNTHWE